MKILGYIFFILYLFTIPVKSEENKCAGMKKLSKEFIKCSTVNIKEKTIEKASDLKKNTYNKTKKIKAFVNFKVNSKIMSYAKKDAIFLHCLPRGTEVTDDVFLGKQSKVWQQALNRVYVQKSILLYCFGKLR